MGLFVRAVTLILGTGALASGTVACRSTQSASAMVDDAVIKASVKEKLARYSRFSTLASIEVNSTKGVVTLAGRVRNLDEKCIAIKIATLVGGVTRINDDLQVGQPSVP